MGKRWKIGKYLLVLGLLNSCSKDPKPIQYGQDACDFCEMTIVSKAYSAQAVSPKGKQYKYDAIECMANDLLQDQSEMQTKLVADYHHPGNMISTEEAWFVIHDSINSPMGANLAAVKKEKSITKHGTGDVYTWSELKDYILSEYSPNRNYNR